MLPKHVSKLMNFKLFFKVLIEGGKLFQRFGPKVWNAEFPFAFRSVHGITRKPPSADLRIKFGE